MNDKQLLKSFTVKEQAYLIIVGLTGSWMYDATHKELENEEYCQRIVEEFWCNYAEGSLSTIAMYAHDTISRCPDCGGRVLFKCEDCIVVKAPAHDDIGNDKLGDDCALIAQELDQYEESLNKK